MDPSIIKDAELSRDKYKFENYQQVFDKMATSSAGYLVEGNWFLLFSSTKNGFILQNKNNARWVIPTCPVKCM